VKRRSRAVAYRRSRSYPPQLPTPQPDRAAQKGTGIPADDERTTGPRGRWLLALALLPAIGAGLAWRLAPVGEAFLQGDELHSLKHLTPGWAHLLTSFDLTGSGMLLPLLQRGLADTLGLDHWTLRSPAWLPGCLLVLLCYPLVRRCYGRVSAGVATLLVAVNPLLVFYSHFARSYALMALLCLLFWLLVQRAATRGALGWRDGLAIAALCALLPYTHWISALFLVPVGLAGALALGIEARSPRPVLALAAAGIAGALAALLLHWPAADSLRIAFERSGAGYAGHFGLLDVTALLVGSTALRSAVVWITAAAALALLALERHRALPLVAGSLGPVALLWPVDPFGDPYAWARYALPGVPCAAVLWGRALELGCERGLPRFRGREAVGIAAGAALAAAIVASGPLAPGTPPRGPYANTYLSLLSLPEFDRRWPGTPALYQELARRARRGEVQRIVEVPGLTTRTRHLYRSYWLTHRLDTLLVFNPHELQQPPEGPYLTLRGPDWADDIERLTGAPADYLILHKHIGRELRAYFAFLYGRPPGPGTKRPEHRAYMLSHRRYGGFKGPLKPTVARAVEAELGPPDFEDAHILAWRLPGATATGAR
jgi:4-amino-4-deoxy-L-arabinose transferase-like glycosyltransferase